MVWYVLTVAPNCELKVCERTKEMNFGAYCPMMRTIGKDGAIVIGPLMPRYLFIDLDDNEPQFHLFEPDDLDGDRPSPLPRNVYRGYVANQARASLKPIRGCRGFLLSEGRPASVRFSVIEGMQKRDSAGKFNFARQVVALERRNRGKVARWGTIGMKVELVGEDNPFAGFLGEITGFLKGAITVDVGILGHPTPMTMMVDWVRRARRDDHAFLISSKKRVQALSHNINALGRPCGSVPPV